MNRLSSRPRPGRRLVRAMYDANSYGLVLLLILMTYLLVVLLANTQARSLILFVQMVTVWLCFRTSQARPVITKLTDYVLVLAGIAAFLTLFSVPGAGSAGVLFAVNCLLYLIAPVTIVRHVFGRDTIDLETILGAIAAYLLIGMFFAFAYQFLAEVQSGAFFGASGNGNPPDYLFFSFTTMTTVGYGNLVPGGNPGQTMAVFEAVIGQLFLVTAVASAVSAWTPGSGKSSASTEESSATGG